LNGSILSGARVPFAMAYDGLFFSVMKKIHPNFRTPHVAIVALSAAGALLVLTGRYDDLFTLVIFASWILYGMTAASVFVLRRKRPGLHRPYHTLGYPLVPALFVLAALVLVATTLYNTPWRSVFGLFLIASGIPFYSWWKRQKTSIPAPSALE
jgi:APA family basic amino acid/polyamine antiporter